MSVCLNCGFKTGRAARKAAAARRHVDYLVHRRDRAVAATAAGQSSVPRCWCPLCEGYEWHHQDRVT